MASIENRSHYQVSVKHRDDLTQTFAHSAKKRQAALSSWPTGLTH